MEKTDPQTQAVLLKLQTVCEEVQAALRYNDHWRETVVPRLRQQLKDALDDAKRLQQDTH